MVQHEKGLVIRKTAPGDLKSPEQKEGEYYHCGTILTYKEIYPPGDKNHLSESVMRQLVGLDDPEQREVVIENNMGKGQIVKLAGCSEPGDNRIYFGGNRDEDCDVYVCHDHVGEVTDLLIEQMGRHSGFLVGGVVLGGQKKRC